MEKLSIKKIAELVGVSPVTVSRVINNEKYVKEETREKILNIIKKYDFFPDNNAISLRTKKTKNVGFIIGDIENPFYSRIARGVIDTCEKYGYSVIICNSNYDIKLGEKYINMLLQRGIDGLLIATINLSDNVLKKLDLFKIPTVMVGCKIDLPDLSYIAVDHYFGCKIAMEYLINLGHKKILFLKPVDVYDVDLRINAFQDTINKYNLDTRKCGVTKSLINFGEAYLEIKHMLNKDWDYTAIISGNDFTAMGAMKAIIECGLNIPDDISLVGYDNLEFTPILRVPLTTVMQPKYSLGQKSVEILFDFITGKNKKKQCITITPNLIVRDSCAKV